MNQLTWIHLSDWHQKGKDFDRDVVRDRLINDINKKKEISPDLAKIDFVVFSADVAFSGKAEEYEAAMNEFFTPILQATEVPKHLLLIVPG